MDKQPSPSPTSTVTSSLKALVPNMKRRHRFTYQFQRSKVIKTLKAENKALVIECNLLRAHNQLLIQEKATLIDLLRKEIGHKMLTGQVILGILETMSP